LNILNKTTENIKHKAIDQALAKTLQAFMQSLTDQIKQATLLAQKNKHRLNILIPGYAGHHYQLGHLQTQWKNCQDLLESQSVSLSEWRQYQKSMVQKQEVLSERIQDLTHLSEKILRKTLLTETNKQSTHSNINQFNEIIYNLGGLPNQDSAKK